METALLNMLMGMGTVFLVLLLICFIISCFRIFPYLENKRLKQKDGGEEFETGPLSGAIPKEYKNEDDGELAAVIAGAIAAWEGTGTDDFIVRTIKRRQSERS